MSQFVKGMRERRQRKQGKVGLGPITIRNYLVALKTALGWAVEQKLLPHRPTFPAVRVPRKKPQPVPAGSFERLLAKAPDALWRAFLLFGCRIACQLGKGNAPVLHELMRHSSMQITMDYYASVDDALQDAIKGLK